MMTGQTFRESPLSLMFWVKLILTLGLYFFWWRAKSVTITEKHVIYRQGVLSKDERSIPIAQILDVGIRTGLLGRILGYGTVTIQTGAYGSQSAAEVTLKGFSRPRQIKDIIMRYQAQ